MRNLSLSYYSFILTYFLASRLAVWQNSVLLLICWQLRQWFFFFNPAWLTDGEVESDSLTSSKVSKYYLLAGEFFLMKFIGRFRKKGLPGSQSVVESFYRFFKYRCKGDPLTMLPDLFFQAYELPFKVNAVTLSNRSYQFPDTFKNDQEIERLVVKKFGIILKKRAEAFFLGRFFAELTDYLNGSSLSVLRQHLDSIFLAGLENRAYVHYRWMTRAKT